MGQVLHGCARTTEAVRRAIGLLSDSDSVNPGSNPGPPATNPPDIASFFWSEIHSWAQRALREVATLARAYGWREADILSMSARRRQAYLEMIS